MDDDEIQPSSSMLPIAIGILAVVLGGAGLYFGLSANQRLNPIDESISERGTSIAEIEDQVSIFGTRIDELSAKTDELSKTLNRVKAYGNQSEQAIKKLARELDTNRKQIAKTAEMLNEFAANGFRPAATQTAPVVAALDKEKSSTATPATSGSTTVYTIESGDYFSKIATKLGVSLQALIDANPGVDSRRLQIGQKINIPSN